MDSILRRNLRFNTCHHAASIALRQGQRYSRLEASDGAVLEVVRLILLFIGSETHGHPHIAMVQPARVKGKLEAARHDADDGVGTAIEIDGFSNDLRIGLKALAPQGITDQGNGRRVFVLALGEAAAQHRLYAEQGKQRSGDALGFCLKRFACAADFESSLKKAGNLRKGMVVAGEADHIGRRNIDGVELVFNALVQADNAVRLIEGQWPQQHGFNDGIDSSYAADADGQRQHSGQSEARRLAQLAQAEAKIAAERFNEW